MKGHTLSFSKRSNSTIFELKRLVPWILAGFISLAAIIQFIYSLPENNLAGIPPFDLLLMVMWGILLPGIFSFLAALIISRQSSNRVGWLMMVSAIAAINPINFSGYPSAEAALTPGIWLLLWLDSWLWLLVVMPPLLIPLYFPDGQLPSTNWKWVNRLALGMVLFAAVSTAFMIEFGPYNGEWVVENPLGLITDNITTSNFIGIFSDILMLLIAGGSIASLFFRFRRAELVEREQIKWLLYAGTLFIFTLAWLLVTWEEPPTATLPIFTFAISLLMIPIAITIAIFRYKLWNIDIIINRTLVYGILTTLIIAIYIVIISGFGIVFQTQTNTLISLVAAGIIAVMFQPLRERLQRGVNRLLYGEIDDPAIVLTRLAQQMETADTPTEILPNLVKTIALTLKLPYVGICLPNGEHEFETAAVWGETSNHVETLSLYHQDEIIGHLEVAPRGSREAFNSSERKLLNTISALTANTVRAVQLSDELRRSRQRIITAREDERRRLRRDLHDSLGPQLASQMLGLEAVAQLMPGNPEKAQAILTSLKSQAEEAMLDIRRLVYNLRPSALDDLGLIKALQQSVSRYETDTLRIKFDMPVKVPELPAAVETAAYRIAQEAMTNVVRHAEASLCSVRLSFSEADFIIEVQDNGCGLPEDCVSGVGLLAMKERASELNGHFLLESFPNGGTHVIARLPIGVCDG